jgi:small subunit ribosomal protein S17
MEKANNRELVGKVVSSVNNKTITVLVETYKKHPLYGKRVKSSKKYAVHDETNKAKVGDIVRIVETKPISKTKRFYLKSIEKEAVIL